MSGNETPLERVCVGGGVCSDVRVCVRGYILWVSACACLKRASASYSGPVVCDSLQRSVYRRSFARHAGQLDRWPRQPCL